ncbi:hypothetical protein J6590_031799 [Homalodisca vitripennis]|nr:hypothetical protein J6590_031799 [Homalodisca vitripennis]
MQLTAEEKGRKTSTNRSCALVRTCSKRLLAGTGFVCERTRLIQCRLFSRRLELASACQQALLTSFLFERTLRSLISRMFGGCYCSALPPLFLSEVSDQPIWVAHEELVFGYVTTELVSPKLASHTTLAVLRLVR